MHIVPDIQNILPAGPRAKENPQPGWEVRGPWGLTRRESGGGGGGGELSGRWPGTRADIYQNVGRYRTIYRPRPNLASHTYHHGQKQQNCLYNDLCMLEKVISTSCTLLVQTPIISQALLLGGGSIECRNGVERVLKSEM